MKTINYRRISDETRLLQKRGIDYLKDYTPWIKVREVPSQGRSHRVKSRKTKRIHHLMSDLELRTFYMLNFSDSVIDIREQFPLHSVSETKLIAESLGVQHPSYLYKGRLIHPVMTTDFLATIKRNNSEKLLAICVKPSKKLQEKRVQQKISIENHYWKKLDVEFRIVTEQHLKEIVSKNLQLFSDHEQFRPEWQLQKFLSTVQQEFIRINANEDVAIDTILQQSCQVLGVPLATARQMLLHCLAMQFIRIDLDLKFEWKLSYRLFRF